MTKEVDHDYCPYTITHRHAWYQTTLGKVFEENHKNGIANGTEEPLKHKTSTHACKCGQWRMVHYDLPKY